MESTCVYEETTVIHELTQGIEMAEQLRVNLNSSEARKFLIQKILSSYDKALFVLKSAGQPRAHHLPESGLPKSSTSTESLQTIEFGFDQNVVSKKRKASTPCSYNKVQKGLDKKQVKRIDENQKVFEITYKGIHTGNNVELAAPPLPPTSPEKQETKPTNHYHHQHEISSPNSDEILSNLRANLSVNTWDLDTNIPPSSFSFPSTPFGFSDDDFEPINFPNHFDDELFQDYSYLPPFISPATSESSTFDFLTEPVDLYPDFEFNNFLL